MESYHCQEIILQPYHICDEIPTDALIEYVQYSPEKKLLFIGTESKGIIVVSQNRVDAMKSIWKEI